MRDTVFISHANPEDNVLSRWLALQLAKEGYRVWCDEVKFLGGEDFWRDAEAAIRDCAAKFLYVLTRCSNDKTGPLQELRVAKHVERQHGLSDFIIPLHADDLPHGQMNIELARLVSIPFNKGWATGLGQLLKKLEAEEVPKHPHFGPGAVASWWRGAVGHAEQPTQRAEKYTSNWFPIRKLPPRVYFHTLDNPQRDVTEAIQGIPYPAFHHGHHLISFADSQSLGEHLAGPLTTVHEQPYMTADFLGGALPDFLQRSEARNHIQHLVRLAWERLCARAGLEPHELADGSKVYWFKHGLISKDTVYFTGPNGKRTHRQVVGRNNPRDRYWHFGVRAFPMTYPLKAYAVKGSVVFSDDGEHLWESRAKLHSARRSECKNWWNAAWRDRILAAIQWLAESEQMIRLPVSASHDITVRPYPIGFRSPVSYKSPKDPPSVVGTEDDDVELDEWEDEEEPLD